MNSGKSIDFSQPITEETIGQYTAADLAKRLEIMQQGEMAQLRSLELIGGKATLAVLPIVQRGNVIVDAHMKEMKLILDSMVNMANDISARVQKLK